MNSGAIEPAFNSRFSKQNKKKQKFTMYVPHVGKNNNDNNDNDNLESLVEQKKNSPYFCSNNNGQHQKMFP